MKVKQLIAYLQEADQDDDVLIALNGYFGGTMNPTTHGAEIDHIYQGFDWDMGKTFIIPKSKLKEEV